MQHVAWNRMFVAVGRQFRLQSADPVQLHAAKNTAHRRRTPTELLRDPNARPSFSPEPFDLHDPILRCAARRAMRTRTAVSEPGHALLTITPYPLRRRLPASLKEAEAEFKLTSPLKPLLPTPLDE
ncbi:MAG: hypothetical protein ABI072_00795 [Edaphobacter sp.]